MWWRGKNMRNKIFAGLFAVALAVIFLWYPAAKFLKIPPADTATLGSLEQPAAASEGPFYKSRTKFEEIKTQIKNKSKSHFPLYEEVLFSVPKIDNKANAAFFQMTGVGEFYPVHASENYFYKNTRDGSVIRLYPYSLPYYENGIVGMSDFYNRLAENYPDLNFSIYSVTSLSVTDALNGENLHMDGHGRYLTQFQDLLSPEIAFDSLQIDSYEDYQRMFYKSDHHWNIFGAYQGYQDAVNMLREKDPALSEPVSDVEFFEVPNLVYRGSAARLTADDTLTDSIWDMRASLPPYTVQVADRMYDSSNLLGFSYRENYWAGDWNEAKYYNHYAFYFHYDYGEIRYDFHKGNGKNLLIFVDSMSNCIEEYIASHFDKTFAVDLRYYEEQTGEKFDFSHYVEENEITDVLFFGQSSSLLFSFQTDLGVWN